LSLNKISPGVSLSVGSTKNNQLALASNGRVFPFGPLTSENADERLSTSPSPTDRVFVATRHGVLSRPTTFDLNFTTGQSPSWKRHIYYEVRWNKSSARTWKCSGVTRNSFIPAMAGGSEFTTREGSTGLIRNKD
jgi:hypothetical protein